MKRVIIAALAIAAVVGCTKDDGGSIEASSAVKFASAGIDTRIDCAANEWIEGDRIGITTSGFSGVGGFSSEFDNVQYQAVSSGGSTTFTLSDGETAITYPNVNKTDAKSVTFYAYYPYAASCSGGSIDINIADQSELAAIDFMTGSKGVTGYGVGSTVNETNVDFTFGHRLSKMVLELTSNSNLPSLKGLTAVMADVETTAEYSIETGAQSTTTLGDAKIISLNVTPGTTDDDGNFTEATVTAILHPNDYTSSSPTLQFTIGDKVYEVEFKAALVAGSSHTFKIALGNDNVLFTSDSTIGTWGNGGEDTLYSSDISDTAISFDCTYFKDFLLTKGVDTNNDGNISYREAAAYTGLIYINSTVASAEEIKYFPNITEFDCSNNANITALDLSGCRDLELLSCSYNASLTTLNISGCTKLTTLQCYHNSKLQALNVPACTGLTALSCYSNMVLTTLDISGCTELTELDCQNTALTTVDLSKCTKLTDLNCDSSSALTTLDLSSCPDLKNLSCSSSALTTLDVTPCSQLEELKCEKCPLLTELRVTGCTELTTLMCNNCALTELDVTSLTALTSLTCNNNAINVLDVTGCTELTILGCGTNNLSALDVTNCTQLDTLNCHTNSITALDLTNCTALTWLTCHTNQLTEVNVRSCSGIAKTSELYSYVLLVGNQSGAVTLYVTTAQEAIIGTLTSTGAGEYNYNVTMTAN